MKRLLALLGVASRRVTLWCSSLKKDIFFIDVNFKRDKGDYIFIHLFIHSLYYQLNQNCRDRVRGAEPSIQQSVVESTH